MVTRTGGEILKYSISISPVQLLRQVHPDTAQSRWAASSSDYQSVDKLYNDLVALQTGHSARLVLVKPVLL